MFGFLKALSKIDTTESTNRCILYLRTLPFAVQQDVSLKMMKCLSMYMDGEIKSSKDFFEVVQAAKQSCMFGNRLKSHEHPEFAFCQLLEDSSISTSEKVINKGYSWAITKRFIWNSLPINDDLINNERTLDSVDWSDGKFGPPVVAGLISRVSLLQAKIDSIIDILTKLLSSGTYLSKRDPSRKDLTSLLLRVKSGSLADFLDEEKSSDMMTEAYGIWSDMDEPRYTNSGQQVIMGRKNGEALDLLLEATVLLEEIWEKDYEIRYVTKKMTEEWSESRRELENQLSPFVLRVTLNEMIDEIQAAIKLVDEIHRSLTEVADVYQAKRRDGTDFTFSYNSVIWGVLYSWNKTTRPECRVYLHDTFEFFVKYASSSKIELLKQQLYESQAYKHG